MRIAVVGCGAMGSIYAGKLAALAAKSPKKIAKPIKLDVSKSF